MDIIMELQNGDSNLLENKIPQIVKPQETAKVSSKQVTINKLDLDRVEEI